jgi:hypothetical protein
MNGTFVMDCMCQCQSTAAHGCDWQGCLAKAWQAMASRHGPLAFSSLQLYTFLTLCCMTQWIWTVSHSAPIPLFSCMHKTHAAMEHSDALTIQTSAFGLLLEAVTALANSQLLLWPTAMGKTVT